MVSPEVDRTHGSLAGHSWAVVLNGKGLVQVSWQGPHHIVTTQVFVVFPGQRGTE